MAVLDAASLDAGSLDGSVLDVLNNPYRAVFGCILDVVSVGCCGFGCWVLWMMRFWMLQYGAR